MGETWRDGDEGAGVGDMNRGAEEEFRRLAQQRERETLLAEVRERRERGKMEREDDQRREGEARREDDAVRSQAKMWKWNIFP